MTKQEQYGLKFYKFRNTVTNEIYYSCKTKNVSIYSELQILSQFTYQEVQRLISEITNAQTGLYFEPDFISQCVETDDVEIIPPNLIINNILTIPLGDIKEVLEEWLTFISS